MPGARFSYRPGRLYSQYLSDLVGQQVVTQNRDGTSGA
jgi:hypothetical protein